MKTGKIQDVATGRWLKPRMGIRENWVKSKHQGTELGALDAEHWIDKLTKEGYTLLLVGVGDRMGVRYFSGKVRRILK